MKEIFAIMGGSADSSSEGISAVHLGRGLLISCVLAAAFSLALAAAYCFTSLAGSTAHILQLAVLGAAAFAGAFAAAKGAGRRGLWHGLILAALLLGLLLLGSAAGLTSGGISVLGLLVKGLLLFMAGGLGGILGVA